MGVVGLYPVERASKRVEGQAIPPAWPSLIAQEDVPLDEQNQLLPDGEADGFGALSPFLGLFLCAPQCLLLHRRLILAIGRRLGFHSVSNEG